MLVFRFIILVLDNDHFQEDCLKRFAKSQVS